MKKLVFMLLVIIPSLYAQENRGWKHLISAKGGEYYYNPRTIIRSGRKVKVWEKNVSDKERFLEGLRKRNVATENYLGFAYSLIHVELDCAEKKYRILADVVYDTKGKVLHSQKDKDEAWDAVLTESIVGKLFTAVCKPKRETLNTKSF
jgi:hypothetical protein